MALLVAHQRAQEIQHKISCKCGDALLTIRSNQRSIGSHLYFCQKCTSEDDLTNIYCEDCGPYYHRKDKKGHSFDFASRDVILVNDLVETQADDANYARARELIVRIIGIERYNQIAPVLKVAPPAVGIGVMGATLWYELTKHFAVVKNAKVFKTANVTKFGVGATIVVSLVEMGVNAYRWKTGQISGLEFFRLGGKTIARNAAAFGGMVGGAKLGAVIGSATCPGLGTACGIVLGALFGALLGKAAEVLYDHYLPDGEEAGRRQAVREAIQYFHFQREDIDNRSKFNERELKKRFKEFSLLHHPDRSGGSTHEWLVMSTHYGILRGLLEENNDKIKKKIAKRALAITHD